ncbi:MAG TPA: nitrate reductase molybdenum cofactor assembly chaperone, partial [Marmoricola sp.]|nr:nitrate reductase molybdenum cofactor assembly chaperone [Marmoricola sp.]
DYPDQQLLDSLDQIQSLVPDDQDLVGLIEHLRANELQALQEEYVATFDHTRRCALYLTYFAYGDTRRRGVALVQFKQAFRRAGVEFDEDSDELPDHLCVVLQLGAAHDPDAAWRLLLDHRAGIEMLRQALAAEESPWLGALLALCATLPPLVGDEAEAVRRLIEEGPPDETVGLDPYTMPSSAPPEFIGMPTLSGVAR